MKSIIVGGGKLGRNLLETLKERGFDVTLIEKDESKCKKIAEDVDADIICGDGTEMDVLSDAGINDADIVAAVTGKDENNLVVCEIAKSIFHIKSIARVNNPKNTETFKMLGVDQTVCSTEVIANLIEYEFEGGNCKFIQSFERGNMILAEILVNDGSAWRESFIKDLNLPPECTITSILRNGEVIYPKSDTKIMVNDSVFIVTSHSAFLAIRKSMHTGGKIHEKQKK
jgi:trk system potassium uptake protein